MENDFITSNSIMNKMFCQPKKWLPFTAGLYLITFSKLYRSSLSSEFSLWPQHYFCEAVHCHCDNF